MVSCKQTSLDEPSDARLMSRIADGDAKAFRVFHDRYGARIHGVIRRSLANSHDTQDAFQNIMLDIWKYHAAKYNPAFGPVDAWVFRLAKSRSIDLIRKTSSQARRIRLKYAHDSVIEDSSFETNPEDGNESGIQAALERITEVERTPLIMSFAHGLTHPEIAEQLDLPVGTVKTRIRRGMIQLRKALSVGGCHDE